MALSFQFQARRFSGRWVSLWIVAEILVFALCVDYFGFLPALAAQLASMLAGALILRRLGRKALRALSAGAQAAAVDGAALGAGVLAGLCAALLIAPGFLTTLAALLLAIPAVRRLAVRRFLPQGARPRGAGGTVDLDPAEWSRAPAPAPHGAETLPPRLNHAVSEK